ncbi:pseudouridylate synthase [Candidatus Scalindua japonica]|uniref:Pseudouridylate synthase n=1 Tax=Candidatus Scalindua japonica TaxID=1284222 RepID=A0A286TWN4_9BACT|nr:pseudouridylate synthase [Candidatus Scalindua japonica]
MHSNRQEEYNIINDLIVNNRNAFKTVIYKSEKKGISDIRKLIAHSQIEESWVYLPHREKWIEIGHNEEAEKKIERRYITKAKLDVQLLDKLMSENSNIVLYHFHPSYRLSLEDKIRKREEDGVPMNDKQIERERVRLLIKSAYPSRSDLLNMIGNSTEFFKRNPDGNITFKVCSHYGITEYCLTDKGMIYLSADNSIKQILRITGISSSANIEANVKGEILERNPRETRDPLKRIKMSPNQKRKSLSRYTIIDPIARIQKAIESMNDEHIRVIFTPYR